MTKPNPYLWPKGARITLSDRYGEFRSSKDRKFDLADAIMLGSPTAQRTVTISIALDDYSQEMGKRLEELIRYDLEFDGYRVALLEQEPQSVFETFEWRATIKPA